MNCDGDIFTKFASVIGVYPQEHYSRTNSVNY